MSTSPETSPNPSPSSKLATAVGAVVGLAVFALYLRLVWPSLTGLKERARRMQASNPLVEQAKREPMTYENAEVGKPVIWCVDYTGGQSYLEGRPSRPIAWVEPPPFYPEAKVGHCQNVLAVVVDRKPNLVTLKYVDRP